MRMFPDVDWDRFNEVMKPAKIVLGKDLLELRKTDKNRRSKLWEDLSDSLEALEDDFSSKIEKDILEKHKSDITLARLLLATAAFMKGEDSKIISQFTDSELGLYADFDEFSRFDVFSSTEEGVKEVVKKGQTFKLLKHYYQRQYNNMDTLLDNPDIRRDLKLAFRERYGERQKKIEEIYSLFVREHPDEVFIRPQGESRVTLEQYQALWHSIELASHDTISSFSLGLVDATEVIKVSLANMTMVKEDGTDKQWHGMFGNRIEKGEKHVLADIQVVGDDSESSATIVVKSDDPDVTDGFLKSIIRSIEHQLEKVQDL